ncbi:MAG: hypothetical protein A2X13_10620 [Bacteroidetes bacterium GWC2_33_15]|nr:MAG: hypothetical protein A2X10_03170 [Bacteroidetes bacterium GWA2_33_15]OFX48851.1 MAG: hypothetical protein A2X13_10620 [Bacteroidetes bacterium GWC2_33_15]OFX66094.1 MAG: hypothetical protein A2X15_11765 [Bacteroidetes bacterium GWB2_32_14]OFX68144.1 MAG: hypothetical protein A2X14_07130 [Bacteroidetes bacterium GWD2_33_33]HAN17916.1 hypothetical protein [Bacteroidales bacterium]
MFYQDSKKKNLILLCVGIIVIIMGYMIYFLSRPGLLNVYNIKIIDYSKNNFLTAFLNSFPSFSHTFSFTIFLYLVTPKRNSKIIAICLFWMIVELLFEVGQLYNADLKVSYSVLNALVSFFRSGIFDWFDILAIIFSSLISFVLIKNYNYEKIKILSVWVIFCYCNYWINYNNCYQW